MKQRCFATFFKKLISLFFRSVCFYYNLYQMLNATIQQDVSLLCKKDPPNEEIDMLIMFANYMSNKAFITVQAY